MCIYSRLLNYIDPIFSKQQFGFRRDFSAQECLIPIIELWKPNLDNQNKIYLELF